MLNETPTLTELKRQGRAAFADAKKALAKSHQIVLDAMWAQAELGCAIAEYKEMGRLESVMDLPQVRRWEQGRAAREAAFLLRLAERWS